MTTHDPDPVERLLAERACERLILELIQHLDLDEPSTICERQRSTAHLLRFPAGRPPVPTDMHEPCGHRRLTGHGHRNHLLRHLPSRRLHRRHADPAPTAGKHRPLPGHLPQDQRHLADSDTHPHPAIRRTNRTPAGTEPTLTRNRRSAGLLRCPLVGARAPAGQASGHQGDEYPVETGSAVLLKRTPQRWGRRSWPRTLQRAFYTSRPYARLSNTGARRRNPWRPRAGRQYAGNPEVSAGPVHDVARVAAVGPDLGDPRLGKTQTPEDIASSTMAPDAGGGALHQLGADNQTGSPGEGSGPGRYGSFGGAGHGCR